METSRKLKIEDKDEEEVIKKSSCSLGAIFCLLLLVLAISIGILLYLKYKNFSLPKINSNATSSSVKIDDLKGKQSGEAVKITLTEADLNKAISESQNFPLKKPSLKVKADKIILSGKTSNSVLGLSVEVWITPFIENGQVKFKISDIKASGVTAPKKIADSLNNSLSGYLNNLIPVDNGVTITEIKLFEGYLELIGTKN